jgi:LCP family protein required for cell wall assembly
VPTRRSTHLEVPCRYATSNGRQVPVETAPTQSSERADFGRWGELLNRDLNGKLCDQCGGPLAPGDAFCGRCGRPISFEQRVRLELGPPASDTVVGRRLSGAARLAAAPDIASQNHNGHSAADITASTTLAPIPKTKARKRRRRRARPWYRRPLVVAPLIAVVIIAIVAGLVIDRLDSTLGTVQSVSTPPAQVDVALDLEDFIAGGGDSSTEPIPRVQIDTAPAVEAVNAASGNNNGGYHQSAQGSVFGTVRSKASNVADLSRSAAVAVGVGGDSAPAMTILIMGVDAKPNEAIDVGVRPDVLMVARLDPVAGTCRLLSIPRDTRTELPGYGETKINHALMVGGIPYQLLVTEDLLGIEIDRYALIDFAGFKDLVDTVGTIKVKVPEEVEFAGITIPKGTRTFDGEEALAYARYRDPATQGDAGRIKRQWAILRGLGQRVDGRDVPSEVNQLLPAVEDHLRTNLTATDFAEIASGYGSRCTVDTVQPAMLDGTRVRMQDPLFKQPLYFNIVADATIQDRVEALMDR